MKMDKVSIKHLGGMLQPQHANMWLDAARGISALIVVGDHVSSTFFWRLVGHASVLATLSSIAGRQAVIVFFLLSGHLITKSIVSNIGRGEFSITDYATARIARIYPPLIGAIIICGLVWILIHALHLPGSFVYGLPHDLWRDPASYVMTAGDVVNVLFMHGGLSTADAPLWSLFIEFHIYVVAMAVASFWQSNRLAKILCLVLGLAAVFLLRYQAFWIGVWGIGAATVFLGRSQKIANLVAPMAAIAIIGGIILWGPNALGDNTIGAHTLQLFCAILYASGLFYIYPKMHYSRIISGTANFSYSIYIIHMPILLLALSLTQDWIGYSMLRTFIAASVAFIATIALTIRFAQLLERPKQFKALILRILSYGISLKLISTP